MSWCCKVIYRRYIILFNLRCKCWNITLLLVLSFCTFTLPTWWTFWGYSYAVTVTGLRSGCSWDFWFKCFLFFFVFSDVLTILVGIRHFYHSMWRNQCRTKSFECSLNVLNCWTAAPEACFLNNLQLLLKRFKKITY